MAKHKSREHPGKEKPKKGKKGAPDVAALELEVLKRLDALSAAQAAALDAEAQAAAASHDRLVEIDGIKDPEKSLLELDKDIVRELLELRAKYQSVKPGQVPGPDFQWLFLQELYRLLDKLIRKAWRLQKMNPGDLPPPPKPKPLPPNPG
jgi:hypothetical protein